MRLGIFGTMRRITDYQQGLFEEILDPIDDSSHTYRYGVPFKTRNMPVLPSTNIDDTLTFGLMRLIVAKIPNLTFMGPNLSRSSWRICLMTSPLAFMNSI